MLHHDQSWSQREGREGERQVGNEEEGEGHGDGDGGGIATYSCASHLPNSFTEPSLDIF
jgi:hypothetical protein